jgi:uncharacterized membrane protein
MRYARMRLAALLLGVGLGASFEGIVFRQILDWHQMLSAVLPPDTPPAMRLSKLAEGWVQLAAWVVIAAGVFVLSWTVRLAGRVPSTRSFFGYLMIGWGSFNLGEGLINHHLLEIHHLRDLPTRVAVYDWVWLAAGGIGFIVVGLALRDGRRRVPDVALERRSGEDRRLSY